MTQLDTRVVSLRTIMRSAAFRHGVIDVRKGRTPRTDYEETSDR
jgi:hypothetical protein